MTHSRVVFHKIGPWSDFNFVFCGFHVILCLPQLSGSPQILAWLLEYVEDGRHMANV